MTSYQVGKRIKAGFAKTPVTINTRHHGEQTATSARKRMFLLSLVRGRPTVECRHPIEYPINAASCPAAVVLQATEAPAPPQ